MNVTDCPGLDGSNPLHFLASIGILRTLPENARMTWRYGGRWIPSYEHEESDFAGSISQGIRRGVQDHGLAKQTNESEEKVRKVKPDKEDRDAIADAYGFLNYSQIPKARAHVFRSAVTAAMMRDEAFGNEAISRQVNIFGPLHPCCFLSALNAESPPNEEGDLDPTALSFSNDGGGQFLHKDFINLVSLISPERITATMQGRPERSLWCTSLNWDPRSLRSYAHQWDNPESQPKDTDVAANALAFLGLCTFTHVPRANGSRTLGMVPERKCFRWPLWDIPLNLMVVNCIATLPAQEQEFRRGKGIPAIFEAERFSSNKRFFFAPAVAV